MMKQLPDNTFHFRYLQGENVDNQIIEPGWPILVQRPVDIQEMKDMMENLKGDEFQIKPLKKRSFSIAIFMPRSNWGVIPQPLDNRVKIENVPRMRFFVKDFGGWSKGPRFYRSGRYLAEKLKANDEIFDPSWIYHAIYNRYFLQLAHLQFLERIITFILFRTHRLKWKKRCIVFWY